jgi:hypothetical protein
VSAADRTSPYQNIFRKASQHASQANLPSRCNRILVQEIHWQNAEDGVAIEPGAARRSKWRRIRITALG